MSKWRGNVRTVHSSTDARFLQPMLQ